MFPLLSVFASVLRMLMLQSGRVFAQPSTDDVSRDEILRHRTQLFNWVSERHLDIKPHPANHDQFKEASTGTIT